MKLSDEQKLALFGQVLAGLCAREKWPEACPPAKDGSAKKVNAGMHLATWARSIARAAVYVVENERDNGEGAGGGYA